MARGRKFNQRADQNINGNLQVTQDKVHHRGTDIYRNALCPEGDDQGPPILPNLDVAEAEVRIMYDFWSNFTSSCWFMAFIGKLGGWDHMLLINICTGLH